MEFHEVDLFASPPSREDLERWSRGFPGGIHDMVTNNPQFEDYQTYLAGKDLSAEELLDLVARVPNLLKKPILSDGARVHLGFDPDSLKEFIRTAS